MPVTRRTADSLDNEWDRPAMELVRDGERFAASLDRSTLGIFAVEESVFGAAVAFELAIMDTGTSLGSALMSSLEITESEMNRRLLDYEFPYALRTDVTTTLRSEVFFWWSRNGLHLDYMEKDTFQRMRDGADFLAMIADNPAERPFYEVGIFDREFIARCLADGVDTALAVELINK